MLDALAYLVETGERRLALRSFEMMMGAVWSRSITARAVQSMARRGWIELGNGIIVFTDEGHAAATSGVGVARARKLDARAGTRHRAASTRMPRGLF